MNSCTTETTTKTYSASHQPVEVMAPVQFSSQFQMYKKFFFERASRKPKRVLPQVSAELGRLLSGKGNEVKGIWLGHSSLLLRLDGYTILTDPVFEPRVTIVGPTRFNCQLPLDVKNVPELDVVLISHDHYDHLNRFSIRRLTNRTKLFLIPPGVGKYLRKWGVPEHKITEVDWWQQVKISGRLSIWATPAQHFSGRGLFDRNSTGWNSWSLIGKGHRLFFSGDSGYFEGFREIGNRFGPFDVTFMECGAYNEHWSKIHMFPEQTVQAHIDLQGRFLNPIHWGTFDLALHSWYEPMKRVTTAAWERGVTLSTPIMGRLVDYELAPVPDLWWDRVIAGEKGDPAAELVAMEY